MLKGQFEVNRRVEEKREAEARGRQKGREQAHMRVREISKYHLVKLPWGFAVQSTNLGKQIMSNYL